MNERVPVVIAAALVTCTACKTPVQRQEPAPAAQESVESLLGEGEYEAALARLEEMDGAGERHERHEELRIALLSRLGRTPEAMDAWVELIEERGPGDGLIAETIYLSSYPEAMRPEPQGFASQDPEREYGEAAAAAVQAALDHPERHGITRNRLGEVVSLLVVPGRDASLPALERFVEQREEPVVRMVALYGIAAVDTPAALEAIERLTRTFGPSVLMQRGILDVLAMMPDRGAGLAASLLESPNDRVRARASGVLRHSTDPAARGLLEESGVVEARAALLGRGEAPEGTAEELIAHFEGLDSPLEKSRFLDVLRETMGSGTVPIICEAVRDEDAGVAVNAILSLSPARSSEAAACLVDVADHDDPNVRYSALRVLVFVATEDVVPDLVKVAGRAIREDETAAVLAVAAIGRGGGEQAESWLTKTHAGQEGKVRDAAAISLYHMGHDEMAGEITAAIEGDAQGPWGLHEHNEWLLLALEPDERTLPVVAEIVRRGNPSLQSKVLETLGESHHTQTVFLLEEIALERWGDRSSLEFRPATEGKVPRLVLSMAREMRAEGDADAIRVLAEQLLASGDDYLVAQGLRILAPGDGAWAVDAAVEVLRTGGDPWLRLEAVRTLAVLGASTG